MPPKSDAPNGVEIRPANGNNDENKLSWKDRWTTRLRNLIKSTRLFIYNKDQQTILGNTSSSWIKISVYYFFFYVCLGLFYSGMVAVFGAIITRESPKYLYHNSQMSENGQAYIGMGFRPMTDITATSISVYNDTTSQNQTISSITTYRLEFLTQYDTTHTEECSPLQPASELPTTQSCRFSWSDIVTSESHPCSATNWYGWPAGQPCVLIKLNKIYDWVPAPGSVISQVSNATGQPILPVDAREDNIYITCNGKDAGDKNVLGNMTYYSLLHPLGYPYYGGLPYYFFPYWNSPEHVQPFVLVQFTSLPIDRTINVQCRAWAPNIVQLSEGTTLRGMVQFTLYKSNHPAPLIP